MGNSSSNHLIQQEPLESMDFAVYEAACREDADMRKFDTNVKARTDKILNALATGANQQSFSFDTLREVTTSLLDMDCDVMEVIVEYRDDVWKNKELCLLVNEFFDNSLATLEFCEATKSSIKCAKDSQSDLQFALNLVPADRKPDEHEIKRIVRALDLSRQSENPFGASFTQKFVSVWERHQSMLLKLREKKRRLDKKLRNVHMWAKVSSILFGAAVAAVLICTVVAAAIAAPPIAGALAAAASLPLSSMGAWVRSLWNGYENEIKDQKELIQRMHWGTFVVIRNLENIRLVASNLETQLNIIVSDIELIEEHRDVSAIRVAVEDITRRKSSVLKELEELQLHVDRVSNRIQQARIIVLQKITNS